MSTDEEAGTETEAAVVESWRKLGRCSSCTWFATDFGEAPDLYGHCKMYPRSGSREARDFACQEYKPLEGFDDLTRSTRAPMLTATDGPRGIPSGGHRAKKSRARMFQPREGVVRRRDDEPPRSLRTTTATTIPDDIVAGFNQEGDTTMDADRLRDTLIDVIENFIGVEEVELGDRWHGGTMTLQPADPEQKALEVPLETFFKKIVMLRDRLRVLEAKVNGHDSLTPREKVELQQYVSRCYGSLTTFNVLFKDRGDRFSSK